MRRSALFLTLLNSANVAAQTSALDTTMQTGGAWSPYVVGALIGVLIWLTFYFSEEQIGASSFYATIAGFLGKAIAPEHTMKLAYYHQKPPAISWEFAFVVSIFTGSVLAAISGGEFSFRGLPRLWTDHYGVSSGLLYAALSFCGGLLMAFGARLAGGCTSGHGISGTAQLSVSSWITVSCIFLGGAVAARIIY